MTNQMIHVQLYDHTLDPCLSLSLSITPVPLCLTALLFICPHVPARACPPTYCVPDNLPSCPYVGVPTAMQR